jgi:tetratricopeptide (TPR) repeat protein
MIRNLAIILIFLSGVATSMAQVTTCPFTLERLLKMQLSPVDELSISFISAGWITDRSIDNPMYDYFGNFLSCDLQKWEKPEGSLLIYHQEGIPNVVIFQTNEGCFRELQPTNPTLLQEDGYKASFIKKKAHQVIEFRMYDNDLSGKKFSILVYQEESLKSLILAERTKLENYRSSLMAGNQLFAAGKYIEAISKYEIAASNIQSWDIDASDEIVSLLYKCRTRLQDKTYTQFTHAGDSLLEKENFKEALSKYENALTIDSLNSSVIEKMDKAKNFLYLDEFRKREQSYAYINPAGYKVIAGSCYTMLNDMMRHATASGKLNFTAEIIFDLQGRNLSNQKISYISSKGLRDYIPGNLLANIPPPRIQNSYISTRDELNFDLSWKTKGILAVVKNQETEIENEDYSTSIYNNRIRQYINGLSYKNGVYEFELVEKKLNKANYQDLKLSSFTTNTGSENCLYSLIMPGWGTRMVTDGKYGSRTTTLFLISTAISIGSKIFSGHMYRKYQNDPTHNETYYSKADFSNKLFLVSGGISATIYVSDIIHVFERGIRNDIKCRPQKERLKKGPVVLVNSPFKL